MKVLDYRLVVKTAHAQVVATMRFRGIVDPFYEMGGSAERVIRLSGIRCNQEPAYFMSRSLSFSSVTWARAAKSRRAHIVAWPIAHESAGCQWGRGHGLHRHWAVRPLMRLHVPVIYIIEDNGVYGLTKGQFSATADLGTKLKTGVINVNHRLIPASKPFSLGATFVGTVFLRRQEAVARDAEAAICGLTAPWCSILISPCVTFKRSRGFDQELQIHVDTAEVSRRVGFVTPFPRRSTSTTSRARRLTSGDAC